MHCFRGSWGKLTRYQTREYADWIRKVQAFSAQPSAFSQLRSFHALDWRNAECLLECLVFRLCHLKHWHIRVRIFPCGQEILVGEFGFCGVALKGIGAALAEPGQ